MSQEKIKVTFPVGRVVKSNCPLGKRFTKDTYIDDAAYNTMMLAKVKLLDTHPLFGVMGLNLSLVEDPSGYLSTLATDGRHIFYSAEFVKKLSDKQAVFGVAHELYHVVLDTTGKNHRGKGLNHRLFNMAADYVINGELKDNKIGEVITQIDICLDDKFRGWSTEEVYEYLLEHPEHGGGNSLLDEHIEFEISTGQEGEGQGEKTEGNTVKVHMTEEEMEKFKNYMKEIIQDAATAHQDAQRRGGRGIGSIPAGIKLIIDSITKPKVDWRNTLRRYAVQVRRRGYSMARPNKTMLQMGYTIPGFRRQVNELDIVFALDCSGSVSMQQIGTFCGELHGIMQAFDSYNMLGMCWDGAVAEESVVRLNRGTGVKSTTELLQSFVNGIAGGGSTNPTCVYDWLKEHKMKPKLLIIFTDGYIDTWGDPNYCNTLWLINTGSNEQIKAPFGKTIQYDQN